MDRIITKYPFHKVKPVFFVSTGRTGTMFFKDFFNIHYPEIVTKHEPFPDLQELGVESINKSESWKVKELKRHRAVINKELIDNKNKFYIESNNKLSPLISAIKEIYPDYRIVHIIRDPKKLIRSFMIEHSVIQGEKIDIPAFAENDNRQRINPLLFNDSDEIDNWGKADRFEKLCWYWQKCNGMILDQITGDDKAITVKFEDIFSKDLNHIGFTNTIHFLSNFLEIEPKLSFEEIFRRKSNSSGKSVIPPYYDWDKKMKIKFHHYVDPIANKFKYI